MRYDDGSTRTCPSHALRVINTRCVERATPDGVMERKMRGHVTQRYVFPRGEDASRAAADVRRRRDADDDAPTPRCRASAPRVTSRETLTLTPIALLSRLIKDDAACKDADAYRMRCRPQVEAVTIRMPRRVYVTSRVTMMRMPPRVRRDTMMSW